MPCAVPASWWMNLDQLGWCGGQSAKNGTDATDTCPGRHARANPQFPAQRKLREQVENGAAISAQATLAQAFEHSVDYFVL